MSAVGIEVNAGFPQVVGSILPVSALDAGIEANAGFPQVVGSILPVSALDAGIEANAGFPQVVGSIFWILKKENVSGVAWLVGLLPVKQGWFLKGK